MKKNSRLQIIMTKTKTMKNHQMKKKKTTDQCQKQEVEEIIGKNINIMCSQLMCRCLGANVHVYELTEVVSFVMVIFS